MFIKLSGVTLPKVVGQLSPIGKKLLTSQGNTQAVPGLFVLSPRYISGKTFRDPDYKRPPPYPYKEKKYRVWQRILDSTTKRFDENSKIIVVDGAIGAGKSAFAKELAEELDMMYMPEGTMDAVYINPYGYNMRQLDPQLPKSLRSYDTINFCQNPNHENAATLQCHLYQIKFAQYIDALAHVLNTGQGVVMDKSCYSDFVYAEAMVKEGFMSKTAKSVYYDLKRHTIDELMRPHLVIYLDMPVDKILQKVKERGRPHEQNSKALSPSFLAALEDSYKRQYLKEISTHAEMLIYDWSDGGDTEVVVEDIERIDFDKYTIYDQKLKDWRIPEAEEWDNKRLVYTDKKKQLIAMFNIPRYDCPELLADGQDIAKFQEVWWTAPGVNYAEGYNADMGDKNIWLKFKKQVKFNWF